MAECLTSKAPQSDFFDSTFGGSGGTWRSKGRALDLAYTARLMANPSYRRLRRDAEDAPHRRILITGVEVPGREEDLQRVVRKLSRSTHQVTIKVAPLITGKGKFQNINEALTGLRLEEFNWVIIVDDDITFQYGFLDTFICMAELADLSICMPAHCFRSFHSFNITKRKWNSLARVTNFVESGPLTAFRRSTFAEIFPFPELRWAWGTDIAWSETARQRGLRIGVVDAAIIRHLRPIANTYDKNLARDEAKAFLAQNGIQRNRDDLLGTIEVISELVTMRPLAPLVRRKLSAS